MTMSDPIADMLTRIRNAGQARHVQVVLPSSKLKVSVAEALKRAGYIEEIKVEGALKKNLTLTLKYQGKSNVIEGLKRVSMPSCRYFVGCDDIPHVMGGLGIAILSTSKGVLTDREARSQNMGGELLCYVW